MPATLAELAVSKHMRELIIKPLDAHIYGAPEGTALPAAITSGASAELIELPVGWYDVGLILKDDAITWSREVEQATINAIGYRDPVRSDITSDVTGLAFTALESNRYSLERHLGMDLSGITPLATTGEIVIDQVASKAPRNRYLAIAQDGSGADLIYVGKLIAAGEVTSMGEQTWTDGEGAIVYPTTINGMVDTAAGFSIRHFFAGPGWRALLEDAGFPALTP